MKNRVLSKFLALFLIVVLLFSLSGCGTPDNPLPDDPPDNPTPTPSDDDTPKKPWYEDPEATVSFRANLYIQETSLRWNYSFTVSIDNGVIMLDDVLYTKTDTLPPSVEYTETELGYARASDRGNGTNMEETLGKIKDASPVAILETEGSALYGKLISVYQIDGVCYLVRFFEDGTVSRIHYAIIKDPASSEDDTPKDPWYEDPEATVSFHADLYFQDNWMSSYYSFDVSIERGVIMLGDTLYTKTDTLPPAVEYHDSQLQYAHYLDEREGSNIEETLGKIKDASPVAILEAEGRAPYGSLISVYQIDGTCYFVNFFDDGHVCRIHFAIIKDPASSEDDTLKKPWYEDPEATGFLHASPYIQNPGLSWEYSLDVSANNGVIVINDVLYTKSSEPLPPLSCDEAVLMYARFRDEQNGTNIEETLLKMQESEPVVILKTDGDMHFGETLTVYEVDGAYFFVRFFDNGNVMRIHRAIIE